MKYSWQIYNKCSKKKFNQLDFFIETNLSRREGARAY